MTYYQKSKDCRQNPFKTILIRFKHMIMVVLDWNPPYLFIIVNENMIVITASFNIHLGEVTPMARYIETNTRSNVIWC